MTWLASILGAISAAVKLAAGYLGWKRDKTLIALGRSEQKQIDTEAQEQAQEVIKDIADERSAIPDAASDPDDVARELRGQKTGFGGSGRKRPF